MSRHSACQELLLYDMLDKKLYNQMQVGATTLEDRTLSKRVFLYLPEDSLNRNLVIRAICKVAKRMI
jgi:hypothetical protein